MASEHYTGALRDALTIIQSADERLAESVTFEYRNSVSGHISVTVTWNRQEAPDE